MKEQVKINKLKIGYYLYFLTDDYMYVCNIDIYPKYQGKGFFKNIIEHIKNTAILNNKNKIMLQPEKQDDNCNFNTTDKLKLLYSKYGFVPDNKNIYYTLSLYTHKTM